MPKETIKFLKVRDVLSPTRTYPTDAGIDFYVPKFNKKLIDNLKTLNSSLFKDENNNITPVSIQHNFADYNNSKFKFDEELEKLYFILSPHSRVLIPSGIHCRMSESGRCLIAANKSGIASKKGLIFGAQVVDSTYQGEIHINVINTSTSNVHIYEDMKIIQFIETPIYANPIEIFNISETNIDQFYLGMINDRKSAGFGSSS